MRTSDADILLVPGLGGSGPDHWQSRWEAKLSTARRVHQADWDVPDIATWTENLVQAVASCERPVLIVAHSLGVLTAAHAAPRLPVDRVKGAFLVALPNVEDESLAEAPLIRPFAPIPRGPLPFPSLLVASRSDPYCDYARAEEVSYDWGSALVDAGESGHINTASGHGPWPEGLMRLAGFLRNL